MYKMKMVSFIEPAIGYASLLKRRKEKFKEVFISCFLLNGTPKSYLKAIRIVNHKKTIKQW